MVPYPYPTSVRKTSVYLPDGLKHRLAAMADRTHRSEAALVRDAIERLVSHEPVPGTTATDPPLPGRLVGVGVGPGAADLLTLRAVRALRRATVVVAPTTSVEAAGRAEMILRQSVPDIAVERLEFAMTVHAGERTAALAAATERVVSLLERGEEVAFVTLGDPNVYSTFSSIATGVAEALPQATILTVPGVMAFQELAAKSNTVLADGQQSFVVLPANASRQPLSDELRDSSRTVVVYKGGGQMPAVAAELGAAGRLAGSVVGELLGMPGERVAGVAEVADRPATYLSSVIVPASTGEGP